MRIETHDDPLAATTGAAKPSLQANAPQGTAARSHADGGARVNRRLVRPVDWVAIALLLGAFAYRLYLIATGWPQLDSDEAVIGLMARHILHGEYPIFFWGQNYMGAFQAYFAALFFAVFGPSTFWLHFSVLLLTMGFLAAMYGLARAAYSPVVGVLTLAWLTIGPTMGVLRELKAIGGYQDILLFGALALLGLWARLRQPARQPQTRRAWWVALATYSGLGAVMGLGLWSDLLILPVLLLVAIGLLVGRPREVFSWLGLALVLTFVISAYPYISFNIVHPNATYNQLTKATTVRGQVGPFPSPARWGAQTGETLTVALPAILGSPYVCVTSGNIWSDYPPAMATITNSVGSVCRVANLALSLGALALYVAVLLPIVLSLWRWWANQLRLANQAGAVGKRGRRRRGVGRGGAHCRRPGARSLHWWQVALLAIWASLATAFARDSTTPTPADHAQAAQVARDWLRLLLVGVGVANILAYTTSGEAQSVQFTSARYLLLVYLSAPIFIGVLWGGAQPVARWLSSRTLNRSARELHTQSADVPIVGAATTAPRTGMWRAGRTTLATVGLVTLLAFSVYGGAQTVAYVNGNTNFHAPMPVQDQQIIAFLAAHNIHAFWGDYWTCYRLAFESNEHAICAVRGGDPPHTLDLTGNRYGHYTTTLTRTAHPAYIYLSGSPQDRNFAAYTAAQGLSIVGYRRVVIGDYAMYYFP